MGLFSVWFGLIYCLLKLVEVKDRKVMRGEIKPEDDFDLV